MTFHGKTWPEGLLCSLTGCVSPREQRKEDAGTTALWPRVHWTLRLLQGEGPGCCCYPFIL